MAKTETAAINTNRMRLKGTELMNNKMLLSRITPDICRVQSQQREQGQSGDSNKSSNESTPGSQGNERCAEACFRGASTSVTDVWGDRKAKEGWGGVQLPSHPVRTKVTGYEEAGEKGIQATLLKRIRKQNSLRLLDTEKQQQT